MRPQARHVAGDREQMRALTHTFLVRFFDNEITSGTNDLRTSFFNLVAFLATPGVLFPVAMSINWALIVRIQGVEALRTFSRDEKALYLCLSMIATGIIAAVVWSSLLIDRRDGLVLGTLPVRSRIIVQSKLLAVGAYVGLIAVGMHAAGSIPFGFLLASGNTLGFALRGILAHFIASSLACLFVFAIVIAVQGAWLALLGPRVFARVSAWLQMALVALVLLGLLFVPDIVAAVVRAVPDEGTVAQPWVFWMPPLWFVGLYETLLGTGNETLLAAGRTAVLALGASVTVAATSYPLAYRRVMRDAVEHPDGLGRVGALTAPARWLAWVLARHGVTQATAQFFLTTLGRVERHRFTLAVAVGAALAWGLPTVLQWRDLIDRAEGAPPLWLLALPLSTLTFLLVGLRIAAALPSDLRAGWIFEAAALPRKRLRSGTRRVMFAIGVAPVVLVAGAVYWRLWGADIALKHSALCLAAGWLLMELLVRTSEGMPCNQPWRPEGANLRTWWSAYFLGFILFAGASRHSLAAWGLASYPHPTWYAVLLGVLAAGAIALRVTSPRPSPMEPAPVDGLNAAEVLDLN